MDRRKLRYMRKGDLAELGRIGHQDHLLGAADHRLFHQCVVPVVFGQAILRVDTAYRQEEPVDKEAFHGITGQFSHQRAFARAHDAARHDQLGIGLVQEETRNAQTGRQNGEVAPADQAQRHLDRG